MGNQIITDFMFKNTLRKNETQNRTEMLTWHSGLQKVNWLTTNWTVQSQQLEG